MKKNFISIIIPVYKVDFEYLKQCILSVKNQTYSSFEAIVLFDGADEETINYYEKLVENDKRFKSYSRENKGVSYTRNEGIEKSSSEWIMFIDADDWIEKDALEVFKKAIEGKEDVEFVMMNSYKNFNDKQLILNSKINCDCYIDEELKKYLFQSSFGSKKQVFSYVNSIWKNFYKTNFIKKNNIKFDIELKVAEDMLFNYDVWNLSDKGYYINYPIYHYRINEDSVMNSNIDLLIKKYDPVYPKFEEKIKKIKTQYRENNELFIINQIERYAIGIKKEKYNIFKDKMMSIVNKKEYAYAIKNAKLNSQRIKHSMFLLLLKLKAYMIMYITLKRKGSR